MIDVYVFKNNHFGKNITLLNLTPLNHIFAYEEEKKKLCSFSAYYFLENNHINVDFINGKPIDIIPELICEEVLQYVAMI